MYIVGAWNRPFDAGSSEESSGDTTKPLRGMVAGAVDLEASHGVDQIDDGSHRVAERAPRCHSKEATTGTRGMSTCLEDVAVPKFDGRRMTDSFD